MEAIKAALIIQNPNPEREEKMTQVEEKKQEKKIELRVGGGGIGGLLVLGGALAAVALWAALRNRSKRRPTNKIIQDPPNDPSEEQEFSKEGEGRCSILQTPSPSAENHQRYLYIYALLLLILIFAGFFPCAAFDFFYDELSELAASKRRL